MPTALTPPNDQRAFALIHEAGERLKDVLDLAQSTAELFEKEQPSVWAHNVRHPDAQWLHDALSDVWHTDNVPGNHTSRHSAVIAGSEELRQSFHQINDAKKAFKDVTDEIKRRSNNPKRAHVALKEQIAHRHPDLKAHLNTGGMARLNVKKTWRQVFVFDRPVQLIGFTWHCSGRSIVKMSVADAERQLRRLGEDNTHIQVQLRQLSVLPAHEVLAQVHKLTPMLRCNLHFEPDDESADPRDADRLCVNTSMPIVVPADPNTGLLPPMRTPRHQPHEKPLPRKRRKDARLEEHPFLPSIHAFRYMSGVQAATDHSDVSDASA